LATLSLGSFGLGMTVEQSQGFSSVHAIVLLSVAAFSFVIFFSSRSHSRTTSFGFKFVSQFRAQHGFARWLVGVYRLTPFFLERVKTYPTAKVGLLLAVSPVLSGLIAPVSGVLADYFGSKRIGCIGLGLMMGGCLTISTFDA